ncbi:MAG: diguanylate cyclase [Candidatus Thiodiazotropha sp.]
MSLSLTVFAAETHRHKLGVLAFRPKAEVVRKWQPLIDYLNATLRDQRIELEVMNYPELERAIAEQRLDFVLTNPAHYVHMTFRNGLSSPLATLIPIEHEHPLTGFGGVIIALKSRADLEQLQDLKDRRIAAVFRGSLGGYQAQAMELHLLGIEVAQDVELFETGMPHDLVVKTVLAGEADAGFVRTGVLEAMAKEGTIDLSQLKLLNPQQPPGFPFLLSTRLYPEWPFAAMPHAEPDLARRVAAALLALPHDGEVARRIGIQGFAIPYDYEPVRALLQGLRLPPYDEAPNFTVQDVLDKYGLALLYAGFMGLVILLLTFRSLLLNRRLGNERRRVTRQSEEWQRLLAALGDGVFGLDQQGRCGFINPAALKMLGFSREEVIDADLHGLFHASREDGSDYPHVDCPVLKTLNDGQTRHLEDRFTRKDGSCLPVMMTVTPVLSKGQREGVVVVFSDISEQLRMEDELRTQATTDALTGLPNRRQFLKELDDALEWIRRHPEQASAVLMVDLDDFKAVNDRHGHAAGDTVLKHFANELMRASRRSDKLGRLGGEEFCVLLPTTSMRQACQMADRLCRAVAGSLVRADDASLHYTVSVGVAMMKADDRSVDTALRRADAALYRAKAAGKNRIFCETGDTDAADAVEEKLSVPAVKSTQLRHPGRK